MMNNDIIAQEAERDELINEIEENSKNRKIYQISKSNQINMELFEKLYAVNQGVYILSSHVEEYSRVNIKDSSLLKELLKERINANLGD